VVFDINAWEFVTIAVVALVVLGPERLPEVMRRAGQFYRQGRQLLAQYTAEAQRLLDEGMREAEDGSAALTGAWQDAAAPAPRPPPPLHQPPPAPRAPSTAAHAGPWVLPAWHHDRAADLEPQLGRSPASPTALERHAPAEAAAGTYAGPVLPDIPLALEAQLAREIAGAPAAEAPPPGVGAGAGPPASTLIPPGQPCPVTPALPAPRTPPRRLGGSRRADVSLPRGGR
jgi:sec-independent protein translocase protein TatB